MNQKNRIQPIFLRQVKLRAKDACRNTIKYNSKSFTSLKVMIAPAVPGRLMKEIQHYFLTIASRLKYVRKVNAEGADIFAQMQYSHLVKFAKQFFRIIHLSVPLSFKDPWNLFGAIAWLKATKNLYHFSSYCFTGGFVLTRTQRLEQLYHKFNRQFRKHDLKKLRLGSWDDFLKHPTLRHLLSLEQLLLSWAPTNRTRSIFLKSSTYRKIVPELTNLKCFEVMDLIQATTAANILDSFPDPQKIKSLGFNLYHHLDHDYPSCKRFNLSLCRFKQLKHFRLRFDVEDPLFMMIEPVQGCPLEKLELDFCKVKRQLDLVPQLVSFLSKFPKLTSLKLEFTFSSKFSFEVYTIQTLALIEQIGKLQELESLDLYFARKSKDGLKIFDGFLPVFSQAMNQLKNLQKIRLGGLSVNIAQEFTPLVEALTQKCFRFETLGLDLGEKDLQDSDLMAFLELLRNCTNLKTVALNGLSTSNKTFWKRFFEILINTKRIEIVLLKGEVLEMDLEPFVDLITSLRRKRGFELFIFDYEKIEMGFGSEDKMMQAAAIIERCMSREGFDPLPGILKQGDIWDVIHLD